MALSCSAPAARLRSMCAFQPVQQRAPGRSAALVVRAASQPPMRNFDAPAAASSNGSTANNAAQSAAPAAAAAQADFVPKSFRVSPWTAMRFNGPVPERVNGRLAMLAFMHIAQQEMETGQTVFQQALALPSSYGAWPLVALMLLTVYAAFPPALAGAREEDFGLFTAAAEKTNGRAAMLGLAVLAALEWHSGLCFF